jgi:hypothetical protein
MTIFVPSIKSGGKTLQSCYAFQRDSAAQLHCHDIRVRDSVSNQKQDVQLQVTLARVAL